jgi:hypothetical protein
VAGPCEHDNEPSGSINYCEIEERACHLLLRWFLAGLFFEPEDGGDMFLRNVGGLSTDYTALYTRTWYSS